MKSKVLILQILLIIFFSGCREKNIKCIIETNLGNIEIELYPEKAPITVANFLHYVENDLYKGSTFFRVCNSENEKDRNVKIMVIQGGDVPDSLQFAPIPLETTFKTQIFHKNGTISMARAEANTATSEFFICINDQPELDYHGKRNPDGQGFAAFGKVIKGMNIVRKINKMKNTNQYLDNPVKIIDIYKIR